MTNCQENELTWYERAQTRRSEKMDDCKARRTFYTRALVQNRQHQELCDTCVNVSDL